MAISTSTLVFALATCVPFGLAIRDTIGDQPHHRGHSDRLGEFDSEDYEAELSRIEATHRAEAAEQEAERAREDADAAAKQAKLRMVYGAEPATFGPALTGLALGDTTLEQIRERVAQLDAGMDIEALGEHAFLGLTIVPPSGGRARCSELETELSQIWGIGEVGTRGRYWINSALDQRAALKTLSTVCELRIEKFAAPAEWVDRTKTAVVPLWAVGRPVSELSAYLAARPTVEDLDTQSGEQVTWSDTGLGPSGRGRTGLTATIVRDRIVTIEASAEVEVDAFDRALAQLTKLYGEPSDGDTLVWKRAKPRVELEMSAGKVYLTAGKPPE